MLNFVRIDRKLADIFTKPLSDNRFSMIKKELGIYDSFD